MEDLPTSQLDRATMIQNILIARATTPSADDVAYRLLRADFMADNELQPLLPAFVRTSRDLSQFWSYIGTRFASYQERRTHIYQGFQPLLDHLEGRNRAPADQSVGEALSSFDTEGAHAAWQKALARRHTDPDGAITAARSLLETVCKGILERQSIPYQENADLPKLYQLAAESLNLAPSQHTEETFKAILGSCQQVVNRLGNLRNAIGDAHGQGSNPVKPAPRHAALAVNLAGTMATFLVETWASRQGS
jgi:hypothetical protein